MGSIGLVANSRVRGEVEHAPGVLRGTGRAARPPLSPMSAKGTARYSLVQDFCKVPLVAAIRPRHPPFYSVTRPRGTVGRRFGIVLGGPGTSGIVLAAGSAFYLFRMPTISVTHP